MTDGKSNLRIPRRAPVIAIGILLLFGFLWLHPYVLFKHRIRLTVEVLDAPPVCRTGIAHRYDWLYQEKYRDFVPTRAAIIGWVGEAITDAGFYRLPETRWANIVDMRRAKLLEILREGCRYDVTVVGIGGRQNPTRPRVPVVQRISRVHRVLDCPDM